MIKFNNLNCTYKNSNSPALTNINLSVKKGECLLIAGESGSGKSTILKIISGLIPHLYDASISGEVFVDDVDIKLKKSYELAQLIGLVNQDPRGQFFTSTVITELAFACENMGIDKDEILQMIKIQSKQMNIENILNRKVFNLSSGEKQRVSVACAQSLSPKIFIFDEPSSNLDYASTMSLKRIIQALKDKGHTIVIVEHRVFYLEDVVDRVVYIQDGKIVDECLKNDFVNFLKTKELRSPTPFLCQFKGEHKTIGEPLISIENLSYKTILNNINFNISKGEIVAVVGKNGAGKTTLAKAISGVIKKYHGSIVGDKIMLTMQDVDYQLFSESVESEIGLGIKKPDSVLIEETMKKVGIEDLRNRHPLALSGGQKQRVIIAAAIAGDYNTLIFDEPTSGLDLQNMKRVASLISDVSKDKAIMVITHDFELIASIANRLVLMEKGKIVEDFKVVEENREKLINIFKNMEEENEFKN